ncbi:MAG TPA: hypothetical protein VFC39_00485 [Acidobacteriaceae bacterium]|nr:hypothetical protein [Acidobacteriaceae bacterium]
MPQPHPAEIVRAGAEVRGTQSFVHVMASVWTRPSLTALEVLWRWAVGVPALWLIATCGWLIWVGVTDDTADPARLHLAHITVTNPFDAAQRIAFAGSQLLPSVLHSALWLVPLVLIAWVAVSAVGRTAVLRRIDPTLPPRRAALFVLGAMRIAFLTVTVVLWLGTIYWASATTITGPTARGEEPNLVLYFTLIIAATLFIFIAWALTNWVLSIAPMLATLHNLSPWQALRAATRLGPMRGKLVEINLVMGIVKVSLIVLALVFSSTPLPFETYTSAGFLKIWWAGVVLLYLLFSDYFHVVRTAVSLALCREYDAR